MPSNFSTTAFTMGMPSQRGSDIKTSIKVDDEMVKKCIHETYTKHDSSLKSFTVRFTKEVSKLKHEITTLKKINKSILDKLQTLEDSMKPLSEEDSESEDSSVEEKKSKK